MTERKGADRLARLFSLESIARMADVDTLARDWSEFDAASDAIASDLDALAAAREAAGPFRRFAEARRYMPNATRSLPTDAEFWALLSALDGKREGK